MHLKVSFQKKAGDFTLHAELDTDSPRNGILGASGCGKSMTLKAIAGILTPDEGHIELNGRVLFDSAARINVPARERRIGYLFQNYALFPNMTVRQNIAAGLRGSREETVCMVEEILERLDLRELQEHRPAQLSGGQQQRAALARILVRRPDVILLDEPFSALDAHMQDRMQQEVLDILKEYDGMAIMVSHDRDVLYRFSDRLFIMGKGRYIRSGPVREVFADPRHRQAALLTGCKNISAAVRLDDHTLLAESWGIRLYTDRILPADMDCVGYRAHDFIPVYGEREENCLRFALQEEADKPFERNYYVRPEKDTWKREDLLTWFVQRQDLPALEEKGLPDYLKLQEQAMLFLQEDPEQG